MNPHIETPMPYGYYPMSLPARPALAHYPAQPYPFQQQNIYSQQYRGPHFNPYTMPNPPPLHPAPSQAPAHWQTSQTPTSYPGNPPALIPVKSPPRRRDDGPPPLIQHVQNRPDVPQRQQAEAVSQQNNNLSLEQLTYKLKGLELKR